MEFKEILNQQMNKHGVSAYKLHQVLDVSNSTIKNWLDGKSIPSGSLLIELADFFDCTTDYLLGLSDNPKDVSNLSDEEREFLDAYAKAKQSDQEDIKDLLKIIDKKLNKDEG